MTGDRIQLTVCPPPILPKHGICAILVLSSTEVLTLPYCETKKTFSTFPTLETQFRVQCQLTVEVYLCI